jgi:hypothetical protein
MTKFEMSKRNQGLGNLNFENSDLFRIGPRRTLCPIFGFRTFEQWRKNCEG